MKKYKLILLSLLSGLIFTLAWPENGFPFLIFFAFVPLFMMSDALEKRGGRFSFWQGFIYSCPGFIFWNATTTWWIWNSTGAGAIAAILLNSLFMTVIFALWHSYRCQNPPKITVPVVFIAFWISWEFFHLHWDLSWTWLNIGNVFGSYSRCVQWYEYTGVFGGALWILTGNFLFYYLIKSFKRDKKAILTYSLSAALWIFIPLMVSFILYSTYRLADKDGVEAVIVQQNTDPWREQYSMNNTELALRLIQVAKPVITENTGLMICPESGIPHNISEDKLVQKTYDPLNSGYYGFSLFDTLLSYYPRLNIIMGLSTYKQFDEAHKTPTARLQDGGYYDMYNTAICYNTGGTVGVYHKSKLVPGVEKMPFPAIFGPLEKFVIDLGGPSGSLGIDTVQRAFQTNIPDCKIGAPICYESIYGETFANFVKDGAVLMTVITNDAWWGDTPGHRQHFLFSKLRAIETRRTVLRSANTGFSAFIDERGDAHQKTKYGERIAIRQNVYPNDKITFYVKHGDYIARFAIAVSALSVLFGVFLWIGRRKSRKKITKS